jgi:hypothetical protein
MNHGLGVSVGPQNAGLGPALKGIQAAAGAGVSGDTPAAYYPSFQNHIEQLGEIAQPYLRFAGESPIAFGSNSVATEQEYDAQTDIVSDQDQPESAGPGPYPTPFALPPMMNPQQRQQQPPRTTQAGEHVPGFNSMTQQLLDPYDPMLDMDPFGLSASMHFPTQFTFDTSSMRWDPEMLMIPSEIKVFVPFLEFSNKMALQAHREGGRRKFALFIVFIYISASEGHPALGYGYWRPLGRINTTEFGK